MWQRKSPANAAIEQLLSQIYKSIWGKAGQDVGNLFELPPDKHQRQAAHAGNFRYFFAFQILKTIEDSLKTSIF